MNFPIDFDMNHWGPRQWLTILMAVTIASAVLIAASIALRRRRRPIAIPSARDMDSLPNPSAQSERRSGARRRGNPVSVLISDAAHEAEPIRGWVIDRAPKGFGLEIPEEGEVDPGLVLSVRPTEAPKSVGWIQVVVRSRVKDGPYWRVGVEFVRAPDSSTLLLYG
jgi:hypothetical protein